MILTFAILAILSNVIIDELDFHYDRFFGRIIPLGWENWWNPSLSWDNKYYNSTVLTFLFSTVLVWTTDAWHFFKTLMLASLFMIILRYENNALAWWQYLVELVVLFGVWGLLFESFNWFIVWMSDKMK